MQKRRRMSGWLIVLTLIATVLAACGGGGGGGGGAESEPIKVGAIFDLTGATADVGRPYARGQIAFIDWKNEQGGVGGRRLQLIHEDYGYQVPRAEELYTQFVTQEKVLVFSGWGTGDTEALRPKITADKIPFISASYSAALANPAETPYNFLVAPTYSDQLVIAMKWAIEDWKSRGNSGLPRFGYLINDSPFGRSPLSAGNAFAASQGIDAPLEVPSPRGATDLTPQLTQLRDYGANYIFIQNVSSPAALAIKNARSLGYDVQFICLNWCANELLITQAGADAEGVVGAVPFNHESEGGKLALDYARQRNIDYDGADSTFVQGWTAMSILIAGIEKVVADGKELTGENIRNALETMGPIDTKGVTPPVQFSTSDHAGLKALKLFRVENGRWVSITDFISGQ